jgi:dimethylamine/trimethylamine dehydrogenase
MLRQVREGILDLVGAARPSIADPFLPKKIREGRLEDIRECIGCNLCYAADYQGTPIRCTQNPAMGEEWRRGWHPEFIAAAGSNRTVLVVGGGPAGLEAARALGQRGYTVTLAERTRELGGRVPREASLPGLAEWARVRDWRVEQLRKLDNVSVFLESDLDAEQILEFGADRVALAIGSDWRRDGVGRRHAHPIEGWQTATVLTPDDIMSGVQPTGPCLVYDDDHYYMGGVVAEKLARNGNDVTLVTPSYLASAWTDNTAERERVQARLIGLDVRIEANTGLAGLDGERVRLECVFTGRERETRASTVVMVTARESREALYRELVDRIDVVRIGDCLAPGTIAACVRSGHEYAQEMDAKRDASVRREIPLR